MQGNFTNTTRKEQKVIQGKFNRVHKESRKEGHKDYTKERNLKRGW